LFFVYKNAGNNLPSWATEFRNLIKENAIGEFYGFVDL